MGRTIASVEQPALDRDKCVIEVRLESTVSVSVDDLKRRRVGDGDMVRG